LEKVSPLRRTQRYSSFFRSMKPQLWAASVTGRVPERGIRSRVWKVLRITFQALTS
jgi:hypothetical protein